MKQEARPCFAKYLIERQNEFELDDDELAYLAGSMFGAGSDTVSITRAVFRSDTQLGLEQSAAAISTVIMAAASFPEAQRKVQEQLDAIIGRDRGEFKPQR